MTAGTADPRGIAGPTVSRRERHRQATYDEIVDVARRLLQTPDTLSLRAIAAQMGMTAPGLYRYVDSYQELLLLLARSIFADVLASMEQASRRHPADDPAAQIVAASAAFRRWALGHTEEFRLVFATPQPPEWADGATPSSREPVPSLSSCVPDNGADLFAAFFSEIFGRLWTKYRFPLPADDDLEPEVLATILAETSAHTKLPPEFGEVTPGMVWVFERAWARLYGTITLEVFGHVHPEFIASGAIFRSMLADVGAELGLTPEWDRLSGLLREAAAQPAE